MVEFKVAVIGAGPAGCMLARLLSLAAIPVTVFESEERLDFRSQGGSLDLHPESGIKALQKGDLFDAFLKHARYDGEALTLVDKNFIKYVKLGHGKQEKSRGRPEIDRPKLREILAKSVPEECIEWGKRLHSVGSDLTLNFQDGSSKKGFDLIVGADGAFSKVRPFLSSTDLIYSGVGGYQGTVSDVANTHPGLYKLANQGSIFCLSDHKFIAGQQMGDGSMNTLMWVAEPERHPYKCDAKEGQATKKAMLEDLKDWHPSILEIITTSADDSLVYRPLYMLPIGHSWEHKPGVTLIGDAAHLMTPFAGEGVNLALTDAMALAEAIIKVRADCKASLDDRTQVADVKEILNQHVKAFEADMFKRATKVQKLTWNNLNINFIMQGPPYVVIRSRVLSSVKKMSPPLLYPLMVVVVYIYFYIRRFILH